MSHSVPRPPSKRRDSAEAAQEDTVRPASSGPIPSKPAPPLGAAAKTTRPTRVTDDASTTKADATLPRGGARAAIQFKQNPGGMHDVEFYEKVAEELPDSTVIHSILYTHRSVVDDEATIDEELNTISRKVTDWSRLKSKNSEEIRSMQKKIAEDEQKEQEKELQQRDQEHSRAMSRLEDIVNSLDVEVQKALDRDASELEKLRAANAERLAARLAALEADEKEAEESEKERRLQMAALDLIAASAKLEVNETLERGLLRTKEEHGRLEVAFLVANETQRIRLFDERMEWTVPVFKQEAQERADLVSWVKQTNERYKRVIRLGALRLSMMSNLQDSESGIRHNLVAAEAVEFSDLGERFEDQSPQRQRK